MFRNRYSFTKYIPGKLEWYAIKSWLVGDSKNSFRLSALSNLEKDGNFTKVVQTISIKKGETLSAIDIS